MTRCQQLSWRIIGQCKLTIETGEMTWSTSRHEIPWPRQSLSIKSVNHETLGKNVSKVVSPMKFILSSFEKGMTKFLQKRQP